jgi:hypothetical protein
MSEWTKQRLDQMITDGVEENLSLDYKSAGALAKNDERKKTEIAKDVSSFANSSGGVLIYGVAEFDDEPRKHLPERLDPIQRSEISKEWLDQVIQTIQPRIEGVVIHPVTISEPDNTVCYVVEVPQSHTAHMARDHRYHKRHNFTTAQMEDYEVRDVMNRRTHPKIRGFIFVNRNADNLRPRDEGILTVRLVNVGRVLANHVMVELELPLEMSGPLGVDDPVWMKTTEEGTCQTLRLNLGTSDGPLFPDADVYLRRTFKKAVKWRGPSGGFRSTQHVKVCIFADEMPPIRAILDIAPVLLGMTPIENAVDSR